MMKQTVGSTHPTVPGLHDSLGSVRALQPARGIAGDGGASHAGFADINTLAEVLRIVILVMPCNALTLGLRAFGLQTRDEPMIRRGEARRRFFFGKAPISCLAGASRKAPSILSHLEYAGRIVGER